MVEVNLDSLLSEAENHNNIDRFLITIAAQDDNAVSLDKRDFVVFIPRQDVEAFLKAASKYLAKRLMLGAEAEEPKTEFLAAIGQLKLPSGYQPDSVEVSKANPYRLAPVMRGRASFFGIVGHTYSKTTIENKSPFHWQLITEGLGLEFLWPIELIDYLYAGIVTTVQKSDGRVMKSGYKVADISGIAGALNVAIDYRRPVTRWLTLRALAGIGFDGGRYGFDRTLHGEKVLKDPCTLEVQGIPIDPASAGRAVDDVGEAFTCRFERTVGGYTSFPYSFAIGVEFLDLIDTSFMYRGSSLDTGKDNFIPSPRHDFWLLLGLRLY